MEKDLFSRSVIIGFMADSGGLDLRRRNSGSATRKPQFVVDTSEVRVSQMHKGGKDEWNKCKGDHDQTRDYHSAKQASFGISTPQVLSHHQGAWKKRQKGLKFKKRKEKRENYSVLCLCQRSQKSYDELCLLYFLYYYLPARIFIDSTWKFKAYLPPVDMPSSPFCACLFSKPLFVAFLTTDLNVCSHCIMIGPNFYLVQLW